MTVQEDLSNLAQLQALDLTTRDIRNELDNIPEQIEEIRQNVETVRIILQKEKDRLDEAETWRKEIEAEISLQSDLLAKSKAKLQVAKNDRENKAAQREIDTIKKNISDQEKELLELMEAIEQYRVAISEHEKEFQELEQHLVDSDKDGQERMAQIRESLVDADKERKVLTVQISDKALRMYERIHRRLPQAIVKVSEPICAGCNFQILPQIFIELQRQDSLITCQNCVRILVYDGEATEGEAPAEAVD